jgi:uncharacterized protein with PQ loop repeat
VTTSLLLAWFGTFLGLVRTIPQLLVTRREKNLSGLSVVGCLGVLISMSWWCIYASSIRDLPLVVSSVGVSVPPLLTWVVLTRRGLTTPRYQIYLVVGIAVGVVSGFIGFNVVGLLASCSTVLYAVLLLPTAFLILALKIRDHRHARMCSPHALHTHL